MGADLNPELIIENLESALAAERRLSRQLALERDNARLRLEVGRLTRLIERLQRQLKQTPEHIMAQVFKK